MLGKIQLVFIDVKGFYNDFIFYLNGSIDNVTKPQLLINKLHYIFNSFNDRRKYILKKYVYTINHKRIAINYLFFSM
jgi:hypothetical protein